MPDGYGAGYTCSASSKKYTSCKSGYYLNGTGAGNSCSTCSSVSATDLSQSCSRNPTSTELSNAHAYAGTISGATQQCTGKHTGGAGGTAGSGSCTGCSSWGTCSGGTLAITSCSPGYYLNGYGAGNSCSTCSSISATDLSQSCSRNPTSTELSNAHADAGTISGATQQCTGEHTSGPVGATSASQCTGCSSWGTCSGGTLAITSCSAGYYLNGYGAGNRCLACTSISATDLSQSCSRNPTSTELSNAHAYAGTISGATQQCTGKHTSGPAGATSGSQCTGCSSWGTCSGGTLTITSCSAGYYKDGNSCKSCPSGYTSDNGTTGGINSCYKSCTKSCTQSCTISNASSCTYGSKTTSGTQYYGGSCDAPNPGNCPITGWSCNARYYYTSSGCSDCTGISATDLSQSCSRNPTSTELSNAHAYAGTISDGTQKCTGKHTGGPVGATSASQCTGCSSWGTCSGGTLAITSCSPGYYLNGYGAGNRCLACTSISATDLSQSCSRNPTSTELSNAHAYAGTISGATQQCTGEHTSGPVGATSGSQCTGCSSWGSCSGGTLTITSCSAGYYKDGNSCKSCPSGYPNSPDGNTGGITSCYSNTKSRAWTGGQTACTKPSGCASVSCKTCSGSACNYVAYSNSAGTGDGEIKSGCSTNGANCQQQLDKPTSASADHYISGLTCPACPESYPNSAGGNIGQSMCYKTCEDIDITGGTNVPTSSTAYYDNSCTYTTVCDDGYNLTGTNTCSQLCTLGVTSLRTGNGVTIPLYSSALSTPSLNIGTGGGVCYGILESGAGTLNIQYDGKTYHAVD